MFVDFNNLSFLGGQLKKQKQKQKALTTPTESTPSTSTTSTTPVVEEVVIEEIKLEDEASNYISEVINQGQIEAFSEIFSKFALPSDGIKVSTWVCSSVVVIELVGKESEEVEEKMWSILMFFI